MLDYYLYICSLWNGYGNKPKYKQTKVRSAVFQKVNDSGMEDNSPLPPPVSSLQEKPGRLPRVETPVDSMLKDMATIIFCTFLLAGWVAFIITYPKVSTLLRSDH